MLAKADIIILGLHPQSMRISQTPPGGDSLIAGGKSKDVVDVIEGGVT